MFSELHSLKILYAATVIYLKTHTVYTHHFMLYMFGYPVRLAAMYYIWVRVLSTQASIILPYYAIIYMLQGLMTFNVMVRVIGDMVTTGEIILVLTRPFHLWQILLGRSLARAIGTMILGIPVLGLILFFSGVKVSLLTFAAFLVLALLGFVMEFLLFYCIGLTAFWTDRTWGQTLLGGWLVEVLGGGLVPIFVLPVWAQNLLNGLPFIHMLYTPTTILLFPERITSFWSVLGQQSLWLAILMIMTAILWRRGTKRYQGYGL